MRFDSQGFPCGSVGKESTCSAGNLGSIPGLGRSPGEGKDYPLQYFGLEKSHGLYMDNKVHGVTKSWTRLSNFQFTSGDLSCSFDWAHVFLFHCIPCFTLYWDLSIKKQKQKQNSYLSQSLWTGFIQGKNCCFKKRCITWELWVQVLFGAIWGL